MPSLLGGLLLMIATVRIVLYGIRPTSLALLTILLVSLNPFVLDYLSAARGYGLSVGLLLYAIYLTIRAFDAKNQQPLRDSAALLAAFSAAANLMSMFPVMGMFAALFLDARRHHGTRECLVIAARTIGVFVLAFGVVCGPPLSHARNEQFAFGATSLQQMAESILSFTLRYAYGAFDVQGHAMDLSPAWHVASTVAYWGIGLLFLTGLVFSWHPTAEIKYGNNGGRRVLQVVSMVLVMASALQIGAHLLIGTNYPISRASLYIVVLGSILPNVLLSVLLVGMRTWKIPLLTAWCTAGGCVVGVLASQITTESYVEWKYAADVTRILATIKEDSKGQSAPVQVIATWLLVPSMEFYRRTRPEPWLAEVAIDGLWRTKGKKLKPLAQYVIMLPGDYDALDSWDMRVVEKEILSGAIIAKASK